MPNPTVKHNVPTLLAQARGATGMGPGERMKMAQLADLLDKVRGLYACGWVFGRDGQMRRLGPLTTCSQCVVSVEVTPHP